jgi:Fur family transcriptional regulator, ferric uptake regulator
MNTADNLLKDFEVRATAGRQNILYIFLKSNFALSHGDIEREMPDGFDRVTLYRTLKTFLDKGIIHKVLNDEGGLKYALCKKQCNMSGHHHDHVHFKCIVCGQTNCLEIKIPDVELPKGYTPLETNYLVQGTCGTCE